MYDRKSRPAQSRTVLRSVSGRVQLRLQTPHLPPSFAQCLQYLQFLQAWQGSEPVQVAAKRSLAAITENRSANIKRMIASFAL